MKNKILMIGLVFTLLIGSISVNAQLKGDSFETAKVSKKANVVYTFSKTPGFIYSTSGGSYAGICVDIMSKFEQYVKTKYGITIQAKYQLAADDNFTKMLASVKSANGGVFGLGNITITDARKRMYTFSPSFINNISLLVTNKSVATLTKMENIATVFAGMTAYTVKGSTNEIEFKRWEKAYFPGMKIAYVGSFAEAVSKVVSDPKAFTNVDFTYYLDAVKGKKSIKRHAAGASNSEEFGIIMPKSNDWAPVLAEFMNSGFIGGAEYKAIIRKHLGESAIKLLESVK
ncbi:MAG: transporter substrate-binding domain-containing protein [Cyclobacteriaceae bacterium]|nr:transporter substrate-binding domain-containing protein [Cyclobacteriaceae bacterium]